MTIALARLFHQEDVNFLVTNRIPRALATRFVGWLSRIEGPALARLSIAAWRLFADVDLADAARSDFSSLRDCFIRELKPGARALDADPAIVASPCDAQVGACGRVERDQLLQAKGAAYPLHELLADRELARRCEGWTYLTLRLTSGMYHRFHAPHDLTVHRVDYVSGDTWNTNPIALRRVEKLFCKNERAVVRCALWAGHELVLVPVASILVASIKLHCLPRLLRLDHAGPNTFACSAGFSKGQEMGWFELGSTIIVLAPAGFSLCDGIGPGAIIRQGAPLLRLPRAP
ncbi:MAG TPA: archaetidylserine decarboxylase [Myxococcales bacterium]|nr:archaetidylserine decarboxylase [Myxococcales bacterium]